MSEKRKCDSVVIKVSKNKNVRRDSDTFLERMDVDEARSPPHKRSRRMDDTEVLKNIQNLMEQLCNNENISVELRIENLFFIIKEHLPNFMRDIKMLLTSCVEDRSMQGSEYATFLGLLNELDFTFGGECMTYIAGRFLLALRECQWEKAHRVLQFLAGLVNTNVATVDSCVELFNSLLKACAEKETPQARCDWYAYAVLSTLPLVGREMFQKRKRELQGILEHLEIYMKKRCKGSAAQLSVWLEHDSPYAHQDHVELLWQQILSLQRECWTVRYILRPYLAFDDRLSEALQHSLPYQSAPKHISSYSYPRPYLVFRLFDSNDYDVTSSLPDELSIERHLIESQILETLNYNHLERKKCVSELLGLCLARPTLAMEHCIIEVILGQLFQLPKPRFLIINYSVIIIELCKLRRSKFPEVVAQAVGILFNQIDNMSVACFDRFVDWFSHHLSNFRFEWNWREWEKSISSSSLFPRAIYLRELMKKMCRLSYHQYLDRMLPSNYKEILPAAPLPLFKYFDEQLPGALLAKTLLEHMRNKCTVEIIETTLTSASEVHNFLKIDVLMQTVLQYGSKSFTHTFAALAKFAPNLKVLVVDKPAQHSLLRVLFELWSSNEQYKVIFAVKLMKLNIIEPQAIVTWIFSIHLKEELSKMYLWELLHSTIRYMVYLGSKDSNNNELDIKLKLVLVSTIKCFVKTLSAHQPMKESSAESILWYNFVLGRFQEFLFTYWTDSKLFKEELNDILLDLQASSRMGKIIQHFLIYVD